MKLLTWNVQWCRGIDGRVDPARIAETARSLGDFDVLCFQEVAVNFPGLPGSKGEDQVALLSSHWPAHKPHFGAATDVSDGRGGRSRFGNLLLSRLPVSQVFRHLLPWPADRTNPSMPRIAVEAVVRAPWGDVRVTTTHLEYYSTRQRAAQVEALRNIHSEACGHALDARPSGNAGSPFESRPRPASAIIAGDFNFRPEDSGHQRMTALFDGSTPRFFDAWSIVRADASHAPTVGLFEDSFAEQPYCFDFFFVTPDIAGRILAIWVDAETQASDHQPLYVELRN
jgi:endonuclease/exonuclease/phosphatase family metal-dependent hydrolase